MEKMTLQTEMQREVILMNLEQQLEEMLSNQYGKTISSASNEEVYTCTLQITKDLIAATPVITGDKKVYYIYCAKSLDNYFVDSV